ncbi:DUF402 domain-containing protein [Dactylosporangium sp. CS-033363]|uniref:DUF402 domain-containing protein n=1 Tax=Dactylosporangium sp. CS-033363 TaxID=3239935 RepID=UPI003D8AA30E
MSDFDYHPDEPYVRQFRVPRNDVRRLDDTAFVYDVRFGDVVLRHFAFRDEWFKVNVTLDQEGRLVETAPGPGHPAFAFNCDVATPMVVRGDSVYAVDLFADVLVRADGVSHQVQDVAEMEREVREQLREARRGLERLLEKIRRGELIAFLEAVWPFGPTDPTPALPMVKAPSAGLVQLFAG